jgi:hypothetical protein
LRAQVAPVLYDTKATPAGHSGGSENGHEAPSPHRRTGLSRDAGTGLDTNDKAPVPGHDAADECHLKHWTKKRGLIRSMPGPGQQFALSNHTFMLVIDSCAVRSPNLGQRRGAFSVSALPMLRKARPITLAPGLLLVRSAQRSAQQLPWEVVGTGTV